MNDDEVNKAAQERLEVLGDTERDRIKQLQDRLAKIDRILAAPDVTFTYYVKTISLWAHEGEVEAEARSKELKTAIKNAGKRHHKLNNRSDWQVQWEIRVEISAGEDSILFSLPPKMYQPLLPGGRAETPLRLRTKAL